MCALEIEMRVPVFFAKKRGCQIVNPEILSEGGIKYVGNLLLGGEEDGAEIV